MSAVVDPAEPVDPADPAAPATPAETRYSVPALDKAFDVLELLADRSDGLSQTEIAELTGRSVGQVFRVLTTLEARGWLVRDASSGLYSFGMAAFDLAHRHPPLRGLVAAAAPAMRALSAEVRQSCNLSVLDMGSVRVIAQVESPADFGWGVRVGALFDLDSATGTAFTTGEVVTRADTRQAGVTDVAAPILGRGGAVRAVLTVPYVATSFSGIDAAAVRGRAAAAAGEIAEKVTVGSQPARR